MTKYWIDTSTNNDFETVIRYLLARNIPFIDRDKMKLFVSANLNDEQIKEIRELPLEDDISIGTTAL